MSGSEEIGKLSIEAIFDAVKAKSGMSDLSKGFEQLIKQAGGLDPKLQTNERSVSKLADTLKRLSPEAAASKMLVLSASVEKLGGQAQLSGAQVDLMASKIAKLKAQGAQVPASLNNIAAAAAKLKAVDLEQALGGAAAQQAQGLAGSLGPLSGVLTKLGPAGLAAGAGLAAAALGSKALFDVAAAAVAYASRLTDMSAKTDLSVVALQRLEAAGAEVGVPLEAISGAVFKLQVALAKTPGAFDRIGLSAAKLRTESPEQMLYDVAKALAGIQDPALRDEIAMELIGKKASEVMPVLRSGFLDAGDAAEKAGRVMSAGVVDRLDNIGDHAHRMTDTLSHIWLNVGAALADNKGVLDSIDAITNALGKLAKFAQDHPYLIAGAVRGSVAIATMGMSEVALAVGSAANMVMGPSKPAPVDYRDRPGSPWTTPGVTNVGASPADLKAVADAQKMVDEARAKGLPALERELADITLSTKAKKAEIEADKSLSASAKQRAEALVDQAAALEKSNAIHAQATENTAKGIEQFAAQKKDMEDFTLAIHAENEKTKKYLEASGPFSDEDAHKQTFQEKLAIQIKVFTEAYIKASKDRAKQIMAEAQGLKEMGSFFGQLSGIAGSLGAGGLGSVLGGAGGIFGSLGSLKELQGKDMESRASGGPGISGLQMFTSKLGVVGSGISLGMTLLPVLSKMFGGPSEQQKIGHDIGENLSKGLLDQIKNLEDSKSVTRAIAEQLSLSDILKEGGVTAATDKLTADLFANMKTGLVNAKDGIDALGKAFTELKTEADGGNKASEAAMVQMIRRARELQLSIPEMDAAVAGFVKDAEDNLSAFFAGMGTGKKGVVPGSTAQAGANMDIFGAVFDASVALNGLAGAAADTGDAFDKLMATLPTGTKLTGGAAEAGVANEALKNPLFKGAVDSATAGGKIAHDLNNADLMSQKTVDAFETTAQTLFDQAQKGTADLGLTVNQQRILSEQAILPVLTELQHAQAAGAKLSPDAEKMLSDAQKDGVLPLQSVAEQSLSVLKQIRDGKTGDQIDHGGDAPPPAQTAGVTVGDGKGGTRYAPGPANGNVPHFAAGGMSTTFGLAYVDPGEFHVPFNKVDDFVKKAMSGKYGYAVPSAGMSPASIAATAATAARTAGDSASIRHLADIKGEISGLRRDMSNSEYRLAKALTSARQGA